MKIYIKKYTKKIFIVLCLIVSGRVGVQNNLTYAQKTNISPTSKTPSTPTSKTPEYCENGIKLNTDLPFIGRCISLKNKNNKNTTNGNDTEVTQLNAFPVLLGGMTKLMLTLILAVAFLLVIVGGVMMIVGGAKQEYYKKGLNLIRTVVIALAALGISGIVLRLINPNFFGI